MGLIQQTPDLLEEFSTVENIAFPLLFDGMRRQNAISAAEEALESVGLADRRNADVRSLSGGEAQRVAVARALVRPGLRLVIADEPTASLDRENARRVSGLIVRECARRNACVIVATHDPDVASTCDRVMRLTRERGTA